MRGLLHNVPVTDEQRRANDRHRFGVFLAGLAVLAAYVYLLTPAAERLGLPGPRVLVERLGVVGVFPASESEALVTQLQVRLVSVGSPEERLLTLLLAVIVGFALAYFLPLRYKQPALFVCTAFAVSRLYGDRALAGLLFSHLWVYLILHPRRNRNLVPSALAGVAAYVTFFHDARESWSFVALAGVTVGSTLVYRYGILRLLELPRVARLLRTVVAQSAILTVCMGAVIEGFGGTRWSLPAGVLLFFWQWERLIMYHIDHKDGLVPQDISIWRYLAVFWCPGVVPNWNWGVTIGQGYSYTHNAFLCEDKNRLVRSGLKLWALALGYLLFWDWTIYPLTVLVEGLGIPVHGASATRMVQHFVDGGEVSTASVLLTSMLELLGWIFAWSGVTHFKCGIWRVCGYRMDPYMSRPWAATNLANFWPRITFHYREFLIRAFYYPTFFRLSKMNRTVRTVLATLAAASFGNLVWGHVTEGLFYGGLRFEHVLYVLRTWPYYLLLGLGIAVSHQYLLRRSSNRKPWTLDRWLVTDVLAAYCTLQFFSLIHVFARPVPDSTLWDHTRLFLRGIGIHV